MAVILRAPLLADDTRALPMQRRENAFGADGNMPPRTDAGTQADGYAAGYARGEQDARLDAVRAGEQGFQQGLSEGRRQAELELQARLNELGRLAASLQRQLDAGLAQIESDAVALAGELTCKLLGESLLTPEGMAARVEHLLGPTRHAGQLRLRLNPADLRLLQAQNATILGQTFELSWIADDKIDRGDCVLETDGGHLESRLDAQFRELKQALLGAHSASIVAGGPA
jgi:flagellar assembly protein FliH